ncbi:hypothetical protein D3C76_1210150 [compost metagenome]
MLAITAVARLGIQVLADLEAIQVAIQARGDRATPLLAQVAAIRLAPAGRHAALAFEQLLVALALVEGAQGLAGDDRSASWGGSVNRDLRAIQRQAFALHGGRQVDLTGCRCGNRWRQGRCYHLWLTRFRWLCRLFGPGYRCRSRWRDERRAQVPAVFAASGYTTFEQPVVIGTHR